MRLSHAPHTISSRFDEDNLVSAAGLVPVMALADRGGLSDLVGAHVAVAKPGGCNAPIKVSALVAGMVAGADSIDDLDLLRHGAWVASSVGFAPLHLWDVPAELHLRARAATLSTPGQN